MEWEAKMATFINLTPHALNIHTGGSVITIPPSGEVARVSTTSTPAGVVEEIETFAVGYGEVAGLPAPAPGVLYVVSGMVAAAPSVAGREDVFSPGNLVRDENGRPVGCQGLKRA